MESIGRYLAVAVVCLAIASVVFYGLTQFSNRQQATSNVAKAVCLAENQNNTTLKNLLLFFEGRTLSGASHVTTAERTAVIRFYTSAVGQLPPAQRC